MKNIFMLLVMVFFFETVKSQSIFFVGAELNPQLTRFTPEPSKDVTFNYSVGLSAGYKLSNRFQLTSGINYSSEGTRFKNSNSITQGSKVSMLVNYIKVPLNITYYFIAKDKLKVGLMAGLYFERLINSSCEIGNLKNLNLGLTLPVARSNNYSFTSGISINYAITNNLELFFLPYYERGLSDVYTYSNTSIFGNGSRNEIIGLKCGLYYLVNMRK